MRSILHIDFNSYFATVEQQANPRLRGKPVGVTGGDRLDRTVLGAASVEAKKFGVKTGMAIWEARRLCPNIILVRGDSDKYLECTRRFLNILKDYSDKLEVFSIDEAFLELAVRGPVSSQPHSMSSLVSLAATPHAIKVALDIKRRVKEEVGEWVTCSVGISYNKLMAKLAGSLYKPDGLVVIADEQAAGFILDRIELDEICGIGHRIKRRLNNMGVFNFKTLRKVPLKNLLVSFKSYGQVLYNMARGVDHTPVVSFFLKEEVKSVGHRHTLSRNSSDKDEIRRVFIKLTELISRRLRHKKLVGKTVTVWYRSSDFSGQGKQLTIPYTNDGLEIYKTAWKGFIGIWGGWAVRMVGVSVSNLKGELPQNLSLLQDTKRHQTIIKALDQINDRYGEFTLQRGILLNSERVFRKPNPFLSDRRFKI